MLLLTYAYLPTGPHASNTCLHSEVHIAHPLPTDLHLTHPQPTDLPFTHLYFYTPLPTNPQQPPPLPTNPYQTHLQIHNAWPIEAMGDVLQLQEFI